MNSFAGWEDNVSGTEAVTVTVIRSGSSDVEKPVAKALPRATNPQVLAAGGLDYSATVKDWNIPASDMEGLEIRAGDKITDSSEVVWIVRISQLLGQETRWKCTTVKER